MTTLLGEFKAITKALNDAGIEYAVCGGWAMAMHGLARATVDVDLLILSEDLSRAWDTAKSLNYDVEGLPLSFSKGAVEIRRLSKIDKEAQRLFTIDFLLVTDALRGVWEGRELVDWEEGRSSVVSKNGLIYLKRMAGRDQDLLDIKRLEETVDES
jgi:hypothetical protein